MVKFLLKRPIAVIMAFLACLIVALVTYFTLPVSLLPDIAIPQITVQVTGENISARELENTLVQPVRRQLMQVSGLKDIHSEVRDGIGNIYLSFDFGTNTDLAFIEVNEKIDASMNYLPKEAARPKAIKATATDIPVFYLNLTLKQDSPYKDTNEARFLEMGEFADNVIKRRIEQLPEVAMADITGVPGREIRIVPDARKMEVLNLTYTDVSTALARNNVEPGSMSVRDGYYEYVIRINNQLRTVGDVENVFLKKDGKLFRLKDFCQVMLTAKAEKGRAMCNGKRAVTLAIIKQADGNMDRLKQEVDESIGYFSTLYPDIEFHINRNQTELLDYTITNLEQNLLQGMLLIFLLAFLMMGDFKSPFIISICIMSSVVITFFFFYLFHVSLNIVSLSGLILAVGMMIDNAIIVTENISQYRMKGYTLNRACAVGTTEMITPMLSSMLTTVAVFIPLVFMSGIAGAIFYDQAFAVTAGLLVSYFVGILLLPVVYREFYRRRLRKGVRQLHKKNDGTAWLNRFYDSGVSLIFHHKRATWVFVLASLPLCYVFYELIEKERMPKIDHSEMMARIEWNENIHIQENNRRVDELLEAMKEGVIEHAASVGEQDYLLGSEGDGSMTEAELYLKTESSSEVKKLQDRLTGWIHSHYPQAVVTCTPPETVFEKLFTSSDPDVVAELQTRNRMLQPTSMELRKLADNVEKETGEKVADVTFQKQLNIQIKKEKMLLYGVTYSDLEQTLRSAFKGNRVGTLRSYQQYLPIHLEEENRTVEQVLQETMVPVDNHNFVPLYELVSVVPSEDLKTIVAGKNGEYIPFDFYNVEKPEQLMKNVRTAVDAHSGWEVAFEGSYFSNRKLMGEMAVILLVSVLLMYFILAAQFESFLQPLIVLTELPIDIAFTLLVLMLCGQTMNLMSAIGIVVTCGVVINDSILKLDAVNEYRKAGWKLMDAIHEAGRRRLRAIVMTSLTTIIAMVPMLFSSDIGAELQQPLAIAMIAAMCIGTLVSLFVVPFIYWNIYRRKETGR